MKYALFILFAASTSWACPDLQGSYVCGDKDSSGDWTMDVEIAQSEQDGVTVYDFYNHQYIADGVSRVEEIADEGVLERQTKTATCDNSKLSVDLVREWYHEGDHLVTTEEHFYTQKVAQDLQITLLDIVDDGDTVSENFYVLECKRQ